MGASKQSSGRRGFLKGAGSLTLSFALPMADALAQASAPVLPGNMNRHRRLSAWLRIEANGVVTLFLGKVELGQGILTALTQVCADELDVEFARIRVVSGDTALVPNEGVTAGSLSMPYSAPAVQQAAAEARALLLDLAAARLGQPVAALSVVDGVVSAPGGAKLSYGELVQPDTLQREATGKAPRKPREQHRYIGRSQPRPDLEDKFLGRSVFVHEKRLAGMLHGQVVRPPTYRARLVAIDIAPAERMPGVVRIVRQGSFFAVVANRERQALDAARALSSAAQWEFDKAMPGHDRMADWLRTAPSRLIDTRNQPRAPGGAEPARTLAATYYRPYQMHASIGPSAAIATLDADGLLTVQTHSQSVFETREAIAKMLGMPLEKVRLQHEQGAGCYGHNLADDAAADAALLAVAVPGKPIRVVFTREQEHLWEPYGSAMLVDTRATLDAQGNVLDWDFQLWSTPHGTRPNGQPGNLLSARYLEKPFAMPVPGNLGPPNYAADRNAIALYDFPGHRVRTHFITEMPLRVSSTRGLGAYGNVFAIESFIDELAVATDADPLEYRLRHLKDERARDVLTGAARRFGWSSWRKTAGRGRGIAFARYKNVAGYCAVALEVEVDRASGHIRVLRAVAAADSGHIVNPDGVVNQIEGGLIQSLSWTLKEEVRFDDTRVLSSDWSSYPILTFSEVPPVEVVLIDRPGAPYLGTGETSQGPTGAALANAVFDATGVRFRRLPLTPDRVLTGLRAPRAQAPEAVRA